MTKQRIRRITSVSRRTGRGIVLIVLTALLLSCSLPQGKGDRTCDLGKWNRAKIDQLLTAAQPLKQPGQRVAFISAAFLGTPYRSHTLIGSETTPEKFVVRLDHVDCFTFLDYVEALRRSADFDAFIANLRRVRYQQGQVSFLSRNHFFSLWGNSPLAPLRDVTSQVGGADTRWVTKNLNWNGTGTPFLPGYPVRKQVIAFIPARAVDSAIVARLQPGDYIGIYSTHPGLDVSHTGIVIKKGDTVYLRHASSKWLRKRVRDVRLLPYLAGRKGLVVYRPQEITAPEKELSIPARRTPME